MIFPAINLHLYIGGFPLRRLMRPDGISVIALASISVSISGGSFRTQWRQPICRCESDSNLFYRIIFYLCVYVSLSFQFILDRKPTPKLSSGRITLLTYPRCNWRLEFVFFMRFFKKKHIIYPFCFYLFNPLEVFQTPELVIMFCQLSIFRCLELTSNPYRLLVSLLSMAIPGS